MVEVAQSYRGDQFYKIKLCPFLAEGRCRKGDGCRYAHSPAELCIRISLKKTKICEAWRQGKCFSADHECKFAHGEHELRCTADYYKTSICKFWIKGSCGAGDSCRHAHGPDDLREMPAYRRRNIGTSGWKKKKGREPISPQSLTSVTSESNVVDNNYLPMSHIHYSTAWQEALKHLTFQTQGQLDANRNFMGLERRSPEFCVTTPASQNVLFENDNDNWIPRVRMPMCSPPSDYALQQCTTMNSSLDSNTPWSLPHSAYTYHGSFFPLSATGRSGLPAEYPHNTVHGGRPFKQEEAISLHNSLFSPTSTTTTATGLSEEDCFNHGSGSCGSENGPPKSFSLSTRALSRIVNDCKKVDKADCLPTAEDRNDLLSLVLNILPSDDAANTSRNRMNHFEEEHPFPEQVKDVPEHAGSHGGRNLVREPVQSRIGDNHPTCQSEFLTQHVLEELHLGPKDFLTRNDVFSGASLNSPNPLPSLLTDIGTSSSISVNSGITGITPCTAIQSTLSDYSEEKRKIRCEPFTLSDQSKSFWNMPSNISYHSSHSHQNSISSSFLASSTLNPEIRESFSSFALGLV